MMVVAGCVSTIMEVIVAKPVTPSEVVGSVAVTYVVLVSYDIERVAVVITTGVSLVVDELDEVCEGVVLDDDSVVVEDVVVGGGGGLDVIVVVDEVVGGGG